MCGAARSERDQVRTSGEVGVPREGALREAVKVLGGLVVHDAEEDYVRRGGMIVESLQQLTPEDERKHRR